MRWIDGNEIDVKGFSVDEICKKLSLEMYDNDRAQWLKCDEFIQNALFIIDFDAVTNMEGFSTPYDGYFTAEDYSKIIKAFRAIGDDKDADTLTEASHLDSHYQTLLDSTEDEDESDKIFDEFCEKIEKLGEGLYLNTDFDMWALLYEYLNKQIRKL